MFCLNKNNIHLQLNICMFVISTSPFVNPF
jgi:hypothetical protein